MVGFSSERNDSLAFVITQNAKVYVYLAADR